MGLSTYQGIHASVGLEKCMFCLCFTNTASFTKNHPAMLRRTTLRMHSAGCGSPAMLVISMVLDMVYEADGISCLLFAKATAQHVFHKSL